MRTPGGSGAGALTIARTSPVAESITTTAPSRRAGLAQALVENLLGAELQADVDGEMDVAVARQDAGERRVAGLVAVADQGRELGVLVAAQLLVGIVLDQGGVGRVEVLAGAQVADQVRGGGAERVVARFEAGAGAVERDAERFVLGAAALQVGPVAGGERDAVAVVDVAARDLARDGIQARVVLRALDAVLFEGLRVAGEVVGVVQELIVRGEGEQRRRRRVASVSLRGMRRVRVGGPSGPRRRR